MIFLTVACERSISVVNRGVITNSPQNRPPAGIAVGAGGKSGRIARDLAGP